MESITLKCFLFLYIAFVTTFQYSSGFFTENFVGDEIFDYIIVGGGTAGCVLATRLAENENRTVLLIESGGFPHPDMDIPVLVFSGEPEYAKTYQTVHQKNAASSRNGIINIIRGNTLGGSSAINGMMMNRGNPQDYDNWARLTGDESWSYNNMLKYFKRFERYHGDFQTDQRGYNGAITVNRTRLFTPGMKEWLKAGLELGYEIADPNGPQTESFAPVESTRKFGRRVTSYKGYIEPLLVKTVSLGNANQRKKSNLFILIHTEANKIVFEGDRAVGVKFTTNSTGGVSDSYARARKEIIISAGTVESPTLLLKSGLGPKSVLTNAGIKPVKYLPGVGNNLHDHPSISLSVVFGNSSAALIEERDLNRETWNMFSEFGDGPYTLNLGISHQAFIVTSNVPKYERNWPNIHLIPFNSQSQDKAGEPFITQPLHLRKGEVGGRWNLVLSRPKSRGTLEITRNNKILLDHQYLSHPDDIQTVVEGLKLFVKICEETSGFQQIGCRIPSTPIPGCKYLTYRSDAYYECYARHVTDTAYNSVGTCKMGKRETDPLAVVDSHLRVIGVEGLRVADASVMPMVVNSNTMAATYAIAEKLAEELKRNDYFVTKTIRDRNVI